jgi:hypothetical protein
LNHGAPVVTGRVIDAAFITANASDSVAPDRATGGRDAADSARTPPRAMMEQLRVAILRSRIHTRLAGPDVAQLDV